MAAAGSSDVVQVTVYGLDGEVAHNRPVAADATVGELLGTVRDARRQGSGGSNTPADSELLSLSLGLRKLDEFERLGSLEAVDPEQGIVLNLVRVHPVVHFPFVAALVVGNNAYPTQSLLHAVHDAERMRERLIQLGWAPETVRLYRDLTAVDFEAACEDFVKYVSLLTQLQESPDCQFVAIFYAGHSYMHSGRFFIVPVDRFEGVCIEEKLFQPLNLVRLRRPKMLICISCFDASRAKPIGQVKPKAELQPPESDDNETWRTLIARNDFVLFWACDRGKEAIDNAEGGVFTAALLRHWNPDGLSVQETFRRVTREVRRSTNHRQRPWMETNATEEIYLPTPIPGVPGRQSATDSAPSVPQFPVEDREKEQSMTELQRQVAFLEGQLKESYQRLDQEKQRGDVESHDMLRRVLEMEEEIRSLRKVVPDQHKAMPPKGGDRVLVASTGPGDLGSTRWIRSDDGLLELEVPPDAASEAVIDQIRIRAVAGELLEELAQGLDGDACSAMYSLEPHGQLFHKPVILHVTATSSGPHCAEAASTCMDAQGAAIFRRELSGTEWELLQSWVDADGRASACMRSFCYVILRCCKPRVSIAENLRDDELKVWIVVHRAKLRPEDITDQTGIGYTWTCLGDCQWQKLLNNGTSYWIQVRIGDLQMYNWNMEWSHGDGYLQFSTSIDLTELRRGVRQLSITCNESLQMSFKLESLKSHREVAPAPRSSQHTPALLRPRTANSSQPSSAQGAAADATAPKRLSVASAAYTLPLFRLAALGVASEVSAPTSDTAGPAVRSEQLAALIVGNSAYTKESGREVLMQGASDAARIRGKLLELGWPQERVSLYRDLKRSAIEAACVLFVNLLQQEVMEQESAGSTDRHIVFIFFAGHAYERLGQFFMCPVDVADGVSIEDRLLGPLNRIDCKTTLRIILCFDACRDAAGPPVPTTPGFDGLRPPELLEVDDRETWRKIRALRYSRHQFLMLWACDPGRAALENKKQGGVLTTALLKHLDGSSVQEAFQSVAEEVRTATFYRQRPWMETNATKPVHL